MSEILNYEMANGNDPKDVIMATQRSLIAGLKDLIRGLKDDLKQPGLTWEQIDLVLTKFGEKEPIIIEQKDPL